MAAIQKVDPSELPARSVRKCKTTELRDALADMTPGDVIRIAYEPAEDGFKPSTAVQAVGAFSRTHPTHRFSMRTDTNAPGAYILCVDKTGEEPHVRKPRKPKTSAEGGTTTAEGDNAEAKKPRAKAA